MYAEWWIVSELDPLQAVCNNLYTALKWVCYYIQNYNATIIHHSVQKQRTTAKELFMDSFKSQCKCTSNSCLFISRTNLNENKYYWCLYLYIAARNARELQVGYLLANGTRSRRFPYISIQMRVFLFPLWHYICKTAAW